MSPQLSDVVWHIQTSEQKTCIKYQLHKFKCEVSQDVVCLMETTADKTHLDKGHQDWENLIPKYSW